MEYEFKGTSINSPELWEIEQKIHALVTEGKLDEARALFQNADLHAVLTPEVLAQMKAAVQAGKSV